MHLWGMQVLLLSKNLFTLQDHNSEKLAMKLSVGNVPLSVDDVIKMALKIWVVKCSLQWEKNLPRDKDRKLTNWKTVFIFITIPTMPLPKICTMGIFSVKLYHREMKKRDQSRKKYVNCLLPDHAAATCTNLVVCLTCFRPGHQRSESNQPLLGTKSYPTHLDQERGETPETICSPWPGEKGHPRNYVPLNKKGLVTTNKGLWCTALDYIEHAF